MMKRPFPVASHGMALVIVLSVLVLLTILVVGFMSRATMERSSAAIYFEGNRNRNLADQVVNLVQTQIDHASTQRGVAWASQPGMVRTFKSDGSLLNAYKLWSDAAMVSDEIDPTSMTATLDRWEGAPAHYVDLNQVAFAGGVPHYPILNPSALDRDVNGSELIKGFSVNLPLDEGDHRQVPMPVRWLYVLEDGQIVAPSGSGTTTATVTGASSDNPIVGRIAFWTDDETAKLNINTASHGQFWDLPRTFSLTERDRMARFQPAWREFQRYPGHPATTTLWPVFGYKVADESAFGDFVYGITPRVERGGSLGGVQTALAPVTLDDDRLYTSVGELLYGTVFDDGLKQRREQTGLTSEDVERARFFLSARSNSPEVNLSNLPRMAIWPINTGEKAPSVLDSMIAFCSTINGLPYYLQREDARSPSADWKAGSNDPDEEGRNEALFDYLLKLMEKPVPGFGDASFVDKYTKDEAEQLLVSTFDYIRSSNLYSTLLGATPYSGPGLMTQPGSMTGQAVPLRRGEAKGFGRMPGLSRAIFHLYVSGVESSHRRFIPASERTPNYHPPVNGAGANPVYQELYNFLQEAGAGQEVDLLTSGILYFDLFDPMLGYSYTRYQFEVDIEFSGQWTLNGASLGFQNATLLVDRDPYGAYDAMGNQWGNSNFPRLYGGQIGPLLMMRNYTSVRGNPANSFQPARVYPLHSDRVKVHLPIRLERSVPTDPTSPVTLPDSTTLGDQIAFSGGRLKASLRVGTEVFQTYELEFPGFVKPAPVYPRRGYIPTRADLNDTDSEVVIKQFVTSADFKNRWTGNGIQNQKSIIGGGLFSNGQPHPANRADVDLLQEHDTVVSLEPVGGDKRLVVGRAEVRSGSPGDAGVAMVPHALYNQASQRIAADLRTDGAGGDRMRRLAAQSRRAGRLLDLGYGPNAMPDIPDRYPNGVRDTTVGVGNTHFWPDFDNGTLHHPDDAYLNRADEGSSFDTVSGTGTTATGARGFAWFTHGWMTQGVNEAVFFSPNKQMPSAGMFGSLPTGVRRVRPWQTLLFRPDPGNHPGAVSPPDHLLLDLFWMPVVEPYAISEPFSSNGKVNMNYQIQPFTYIHRTTSLLGVLNQQELLVLDNTHVRPSGGALNSVTGYGSHDEYKKVAANDLAGSFSQLNYRKRLNLSPITGTLKAFEDRFAANDVFRSETEICTLPLIPDGESWSAAFEQDYWDSRRLTGDNSREMPYTHLLPRLTTRSNTYTVHFRVQSLKKRASSLQSEWDEARDNVMAEYRGSRTIERYIDPNDTAIPDYPSQGDLEAVRTLDAFYRWRVLHNRTFAP